jgi:hypothetical protein
VCTSLIGTGRTCFTTVDSVPVIPLRYFLRTTPSWTIFASAFPCPSQCNSIMLFMFPRDPLLYPFMFHIRRVNEF